MISRKTTTWEQLKGEIQVGKKKFVRYQEGAELYSIGLHTFQQLAKEAGAVYKIKKIALVNTEVLDEYLEIFREPPQ